MKAIDVLRIASPVMPVANFASVRHAEACADLYAEAGVPAIEITLRTPDAWEYVAIFRKVMRRAIIGVGTVNTKEQLHTALNKADFALSPGFLPDLLQNLPTDYPYIPGVASASEIMQAQAAGFSNMKLFPASAVGGLNVLKAFAGPFPEVSFCPTGGVSAVNMADYLELSNVPCVGGSWVVPSLKAIKSRHSDLLAELTSLYGGNRAY